MEKMKKIALCIEDYIIDYSPSILNLIDFFARFLTLHLYLREVYFVQTSLLKHKNIQIFRVKNKLSCQVIVKSIGRFVRELAKIVVPGKKSSLFRLSRSISSRKIRNTMPESQYDRLICIDPGGMILCKELFPASRPVYYSLELFLKDDHLWEYYPAPVVRRVWRMMEKERGKIPDISALIIQSEEKADLFIGDYGIQRRLPTFLLPVTCRGGAVREKSPFIRDRYGVDRDKLIALHLGGMNDWFSCLEIARLFSRIPNWVLFFQGNHDQRYLRRFQGEMRDIKAENIIVSDTFYAQLESLDPIMMSADAGIAWYNDISKNFTTAGKSSGKISAYLRFGLAVVAKRYPSTREVIEDTGSGRCVDRVEEIPDVLPDIEKNLPLYAENARKEYERSYRFENYQNQLKEFILGEV